MVVIVLTFVDAAQQLEVVDEQIRDAFRRGAYALCWLTYRLVEKFNLCLQVLQAAIEVGDSEALGAERHDVPAPIDVARRFADLGEGADF